MNSPYGNTLGCGTGTQDAARQLEIHGALSDQTSRIDSLESTAQALIARLSPLMASCATKDCSSPRPSYSCEMAARLDGSNWRVENIESALRDALSRLEL